jgi:anti-sigma B factor antagonist
VQLDVLRRDLRPADASGGPAAVVLTVLGDLDMAGAPGLRQAVVVEVVGGARLVVLDLTAVDFVDSAGLGVVVGALRRLRAHDGDLVVVCPEPRIRRVFEMCDLDRVFALYRDVDAAAAAMAGRALA